MDKFSRPRDGIFTLVLITFLALGGIWADAQDLVPISSIAGGSSVFVFRGSTKAAPKKYVSRAKAKRSTSSRSTTARKVSTQYKSLAKVEPRRQRTDSVDPDNLPPEAKLRTMPPLEASTVFAGVGEYYIDQNNLDEAITFFRESMRLNAKNRNATNGLSEALALKGNELLVKDNPSIARPFFDEAIKLNAGNAPAYFGIGEIFSGLDDENNAVASYEKALQHDKDLTEIYVPLGILYYQKGGAENVAKADRMLSQAMAVSPDNAETQYFYGLIKSGQGRDEEALVAFTRATQLDPQHVESVFHRAESLSGLNRLNEAIVDYNKAVGMRANYFEAWFGLGSAYQRAGETTEAIEAYKRAAKLRNDNAETFLNLGDLYREAGNYNNAESNYNLAVLFLERQKDFDKEDAADIYSKIGFVIARQCEINTRAAKPCKWNAGIKALERSVELGRNNIDYANLGWAYYNAAGIDLAAASQSAVSAEFKEAKRSDAKAKLEKAKENLQKAVATNPKYIEGPLLNLGMTLTDLGDYAGAVDALSKVTKKEPKWVFAINELGIAYRKQNKFKEAIEQFKTAIKRDDKYAIAHYNLGEAELRNGNLGEAKKAHDKLVKLGRKDLAQQLELMSSGAVLR